MASPPEKRKAEGGEVDAKRAKTEAAEVGTEDDEFDLLMEAGTIADDADKVAPAKDPEEASRLKFVARLTEAERIDGDALPDIIEHLQTTVSKWVSARRWRCSALVLVYVARSSRVCRAAFVSEGLPVLGSVLQEGVNVLESSDPDSDRQEAGMWVLACLSCLRSLPIGRATMWEHRAVLGKPFDRLHKWCGTQQSAIAAELRIHTTALCRRWRKQPKPAEQEPDPNQKALRRKVVEMVVQGLQGIAGLNSPASPGVLASPGRLPPVTCAAEVEAVLFARYNHLATAEYRQHARMLRSNLALPGNAALREGVASGEVSPEELIAMNSNALAPGELQEQRLLQQQRAIRATILEKKLMPPKVEDREKKDYSEMHLTEQPVALLESGLSRSNSGLSLSSGNSWTVGAFGSSASSLQAGPPMPPPPTPFQDGFAAVPASFLHGGASPAMEITIMATPAPGEEDEDESSLITWLSRPI